MKNIISKKNFSNFSILLIFLSHFCSLASSKNITLSETYYYGKDLSENKACEIALNKAKKKQLILLAKLLHQTLFYNAKSLILKKVANNLVIFGQSQQEF